MKWHDYQEDVAKYFRQLSCDVEVDARVQGARASHNIDVLVKFRHFGLELQWVIECKQYNRPVPKEKVLALKGVVDDVGADRGVLLAESGFQPGAISAAASTNISLLTFAKLCDLTNTDLLLGIAEKLEEKAELLFESIYGLFNPEPEPWYTAPRQGVDENGYFEKVRGLSILRDGLRRGRRGRFPALIGATHGPEDKLIFAHNLDELVELAGLAIEKIEKWAKDQQEAIRKLERRSDSRS